VKTHNLVGTPSSAYPESHFSFRRMRWYTRVNKGVKASVHSSRRQVISSLSKRAARARLSWTVIAHLTALEHLIPKVKMVIDRDSLRGTPDVQHFCRRQLVERELTKGVLSAICGTSVRSCRLDLSLWSDNRTGQVYAVLCTLFISTKDLLLQLTKDLLLSQE